MTTDKSGRVSAGILLWRRDHGELEVLLAHMGGPCWVKKDRGHWTIPKGEIEPGEEARSAIEHREHKAEAASVARLLTPPLRGGGRSLPPG